jgi:hypothetical protein
MPRHNDVYRDANRANVPTLDSAATAATAARVRSGFSLFVFPPQVESEYQEWQLCEHLIIATSMTG